tara:strand:+ start:2372 stop:3340 length:969 start_codon:yes stop_codon:yes gene_type:complete
MRLASSATLFASLFALAACGGSPEASETADTAMDSGSDAVVAETVDDSAAMSDEAEMVDPAAETGTLAWAAAGEWRDEDDAARDVWRHPVETLEFFEVDPAGTIIEIWPGAGWYTEILAPWVAANGGQLIGATFPADSESENRRNSRAAFEAHFSSDPVYGNVQVADFNAETGDIVAPGTADTVLSFRNIHNWMGGGFAERAFADFFRALKPGGTLGIVEHRLPDTREQDPRAGTGYVQEAYVIALAEEAGFELVASSEVNANPADTADHPNGVWTLPPSANTGEDVDRSVFDAIGESDRMTLLFRKPLSTPNTETDAPVED